MFDSLQQFFYYWHKGKVKLSAVVLVMSLELSFATQTNYYCCETQRKQTENVFQFKKATNL